MADRAPLAGHRVLVTRPSHQAEGFCERIEQSGGEFLARPTIEIEALEPAGAGADKADIVIVTSSNAVRCGLAQLQTLANINPDVKFIAIGSATAKQLRDANIPVAAQPSHAGSEGALDLDELKSVTGKVVVIVGGQGGRGLLQEILSQRAANVHMLEVYRRRLPNISADALAQELRENPVSIVTAHSRAALENLLAMLGDKHRALITASLPVVPTPGMVKLCARHGFEQDAELASSAEDDDMHDALLVAARKMAISRE